MEEILSSSKALLFAVIAIIGICIKAAKSLIEFNDDILRHRRSKYLQFVREEAGSSEAVYGLIDALRAEEAFKRIFGIHASPRLARAIKDLFDKKQFSIRELRESALYFRIDESGRIRSNSGKVGIFIKWVVGGLLILYALLAFTIIYPLILRPSVSTVIAALLILAIFLFMSWYFGRDVRQAITADRVDARIQKLHES